MGELYLKQVRAHTSYTHNLLFAHVKRNAVLEFAVSVSCLHVTHLRHPNYPQDKAGEAGNQCFLLQDTLAG